MDPALLKEQGLIDASKHPVKVLGEGELTRPLTVRVPRFSKSAMEKILAAGGSAELIVKPGGGHPWLTMPEEVEVMALWFDKQL